MQRAQRPRRVPRSLPCPLQNRYQRRRMYTRIALGKNSAMDVVAGESSGSQGQLLLLYPMLFALQLCQFAIGAGVAYKTYPAFFSREGWIEVEVRACRGGGGRNSGKGDKRDSMLQQQQHVVHAARLLSSGWSIPQG